MRPARVHGHLFARDRVHFEGDQKTFSGALSDCAKIRDYNGRMFLRGMIWNTRGERQCFIFGPRDEQYISWDVARDPNAQISVVAGAWAVPLFRSNANFSEIRSEAARLQKIESEHLEILRSIYTKARVRIWTLADFLESPIEALQSVIDEITGKNMRRLSEAPKMVDLQGFAQFIQNLKNQGMHPYLVGDFPPDDNYGTQKQRPQKPYLVR